jgi:hypothetical protein
MFVCWLKRLRRDVAAGRRHYNGHLCELRHRASVSPHYLHFRGVPVTAEPKARDHTGAPSLQSPSPPALRNGGSGGGCSLHSLRSEARSLALAQPPANAGVTPPSVHQHTTAAVPSTPDASQRGFRGPAACDFQRTRIACQTIRLLLE